MKQLIRILITLNFCLASQPVLAQKTSPLWADFVKAKKLGKIPVLPDFSYAGYGFSEIPIPSVGDKAIFKVDDYGARANDDQFDDEAIQKAVDAAEAHPGGGVVFFSPGKYLIAADNDAKKQIRISKSGIVLKGSGSGVGGTEIYQGRRVL